MNPEPKGPRDRIAVLRDRPPRVEARYVLYWMTTARRPAFNHALDRALAWCRRLKKPLLVLEALRCGYRWASPRFHHFIIDGMADNKAAFDRAGVFYYPYVEPEPGAGKGLLEALSAEAALVVCDDFPCFFFPRMQAAVAAREGPRLERVDGNGLYPIRATERLFTVAHSFRRHLQKELGPYLSEAPRARPFAGLSLPAAAAPPASTRSRWPPAAALILSADRDLSGLPLDAGVGRLDLRGGPRAGRARLQAFLEGRARRYREDRSRPLGGAASGLSPYLHFGQVGAWQVFHGLTEGEAWRAPEVFSKATGKREGWWGMSPWAEAFLDELVVWRELGFNRGAHDPQGYDRYATLPGWALQTLDEHHGDARDPVYELEVLAAAETQDALWNACQRQLLREGTITNYLRMLWGKKIFEWSPSPEEALARLIELNNRYAIDGRDPNSYSGIFWCLGRFDRAWGPRRPIYGKVRYMSSDAARRKLDIKPYLERFGA